MARILEIETARRPGNLEALAELGHIYTSLGRYAEGLAVDRRLARLMPTSPTVYYNLACSLALLGQTEESLNALEQAVEFGYDDADFLRSDEDLRALRDNPRFERLLGRLREGSF